MTWKSNPKPDPPKKKKKVNYIKVYCDFFGYSTRSDEWIPSEISKEKSEHKHHIYPKGMGGRKTFVHDGITYDIDCIENLIALTPDEHTIAHDPSHLEHKTKFELWDLHQERMEAHINVSRSIINGK